MKEQTSSIKMLRKLVDIVYIISTLNIPSKSEVEKIHDEIEKILQVDPLVELQEAFEVLRARDRLEKGDLSPKEREQALNALARYRDGVDQQTRPEQTVNPDDAILNFYENQMQGRA
jgi:hypothetical protein